MRLTRIESFAALVVVLVCASSAMAGTSSYTGTLTYVPPIDSTDGLRATGGGWNDGLTLAWLVEDTHGIKVNNVAYDWYYQYDFSVASEGQGGLSYFLLEVTPGFVLGDIQQLTGTTAASGGVAPWTNKLPNGKDNKGVPNGSPDLTGTDSLFVMFEKPFTVEVPGIPGNLDWRISFYSNHAPFWGDFFAEDGSAGSNEEGLKGIFNTGYNRSFSLKDPTNAPGTNPNDPLVFGNILRPDGVSAIPPVPEPLTVASAFFAIAGLGGYIRRRTGRAVA